MNCTNCRNEVPDSAKVCGYCGHVLKAIGTPAVSAPLPIEIHPIPQRKSLPGWVWALTAGLGTIIVASIFFAVFWKPSTPVVLPENPAASAPQTAPTICKDKLAFVSDVTVPDGTTFKPGETFTKIWRIKNVGTCIWTTSYQLVFKDGRQMDAPQAVLLTNSVSPEQEFDISVNFTTPIIPDSYKSFWQLQNADGAVVPVEGVENNSIFVDIKVQATELIPLPDIVSNPEIIYQNGFDKDPSWGTWGTVNISDSKIIIKGTGGGGSGFTSNRFIQNIDHVILARFQVKEDSQCNLKLRAGKWGAVSWRAVGIGFDLNKKEISTDVEFGESPQYLGGKSLSGNLVIGPNKWYYFLIGISGEGEFDARLWDELNSASNKTVTWQLGKDWQNMTWKLEPWCGKGEMEIDDYHELILSIQNIQLP